MFPVSTSVISIVTPTAGTRHQREGREVAGGVQVGRPYRNSADARLVVYNDRVHDFLVSRLAMRGAYSELLAHTSGIDQETYLGVA